MKNYTPINSWKLKTKEAKEFLKQAKMMSVYSVDKIRVNNQIFDELLDSVVPSLRHEYFDGIPFEGKTLVRV